VYVIVFAVLEVMNAKGRLPELQTSLVRLIVYPAQPFGAQLTPETLTVVPELAAAAVPVKKTLGRFTSQAFVASAPPHRSNGK
jgi:hypothetical protein